MRSPSRRRGIALVAGATALFAISPAVSSDYMGEMTPIEIAFYRAIAASVILGALVMARGEAADLRGRWAASALAVGALLYAPQLLLFLESLRYLSASVAVALIYIYPVMVVLLGAALIRRKPSVKQVGLFVPVMLGLALVCGAFGADLVSVEGILLVLASAGIYSVYLIAASRLVQRVPVFPLVLVVTLGSLVGAAVIGLLVQPIGLPPSSGALAGIAVLTALYVVPISLLYAGLSHVTAASAAVIDSSQPVIALLIAVLVLGEASTGAQWLGVAVVTVGVSLLMRRSVDL